MTGAAPTDAPRALLAALAEPVVGRVPGWEVVAQPWASTPILVHLGTNGRWFSTAWVVPAEGRVYVATSNSGAREANEAINAAIATTATRWFPPVTREIVPKTSGPIIEEDFPQKA